MYIFRLKLNLSGQASSCNMFELRDAIGAQLVNGSHCGDDYLIVDESDVDITKEIMDECNFPYEEVSELPYSLRGYVL